MFYKKTLTIIIPVYNRLDSLKVLLESIFKTDMNQFQTHIIIVDDASTDNIFEEIKLLNEDIEIIRNEAQKGQAYSRNLAVRKTDSDYIWFLDSDAEILNPAILNIMVNILLSDSRICATGGVVEKVRGKEMILEGKILLNYLFAYDAFIPEKYPSKYVFGISSTNFFINRANFLSVGGFDETLKRDEDADLCLKLNKRGFLFYQGNNTVVLHRLSNKGRAGIYADHYKSKKKYIKALLETRLLIMNKHAPFRIWFLPLLDFLATFQLLFQVARWQHHQNLSRLKLAGYSMRSKELILIVIQVIKNYFHGWRILFCQSK